MTIGKFSSAVQFLKGGKEPPGNARWVPTTDVYESAHGLVIKAELAGMRSDSLEIVVEGNRLRISGTRTDGCRPPDCTFLAMEINYGPFQCELELPKRYDLSQAKAAYLNGFLRIDVPLAGVALKKQAPPGRGNTTSATGMIQPPTLLRKPTIQTTPR